jgi:hypothetical protein
MSFSYSSGVITQTGTDTDLSGLSGLTGVVVSGDADVIAIYTMSATRLVVEGSLIIDGDYEQLVFEGDCPHPNIDNSGTLQIGRKSVSGGVTRYSSGTPIIMRQGSSDAQTNSVGGLVGRATNTFFGYGGMIISGSGISIGGQLNTLQDTTVIIESLDIYFTLNGNGTAGQLRFDNKSGSSIDVSGLTLDCDPAILSTKRSVVLFAQDYTSFSAKFKCFSLQSFIYQTFGLRFDDLSFDGNFRPYDLVSNGGGEVFALVDSDKGSQANFKIEVSASHHFSFFGTAKIKVQDTTGGNIVGVKYYIADVDDGNRFSPIGTTTAISSLMTNYGTVGSNIYSGTTDGNGEADSVVLMSTWVPTGSTTSNHSDYSNGGSLSDSFDVFACHYNYLLGSQSSVLRNNGGTDVRYYLPIDALVTETTKAITDAYTTLNDALEVYDRAKSELYDNYAGESSLTVGRSGYQIELAEKTLVVDDGAVSPYDLTGSEITVKSSAFTGGATATTGGVTFTGAVVIQNARYDCDLSYDSTAATVTNVTCTGQMDFTTAGTYNLVGCEIDEVTNSSGGAITLNLSGGTTIATNTGPNITLASSTTFELTGLIAGSEVRVYQAGTTTEVDGVENSSTTFSATIAIPSVDLVIFNTQYKPLRTLAIDTTVNVNLPIQQIFDRNYTNP